MKKLATAAALKLSLYYLQKDDSEIFAKYTRLLDSGANEKQLKKAEDFSSLKQSDYSDYHMLRLLESCAGNAISLTVLELCALNYMDSRSLKLFNRIVPDLEDGVSAELASKLVYPNDEFIDHLEEIYDCYDKLALPLLADENNSDLARLTYRMDARLAGWLKGIDVPDLTHLEYVNFVFPDEEPGIYGVKDKIYSFIGHMESYYDYLGKNEEECLKPVTLIISGDRESGRFTVAESFSFKSKIPLVTIDFDYLMKKDNPKKALNLFMKECLLTEGAPCIRNIHSEKDTFELIKRVRKASTYFGCRPLILTVDKDVKLVPSLEGNIFTYNVDNLSSFESKEIWDGYIKEFGIKAEIDTAKLAGMMNLTAGQIKRIVQNIAVKSRSQFPLSEKDIFALCYEMLDDGRYDNIKRVHSIFSLSDVKTSEANKKILNDIKNQVLERSRVYTDWNMSSKYSYGRCVSVILAGPPGTGKTMAVHALSTELGLELYKVDLSQLVDKYIGETEKRLEDIFKKAESSNMILFFDEADAIMGKRSETKDAHDKYANTEIAYILQRIEEYDGIVILATNYLQNIDPAFMRRIKYVVNFDIPDIETRKNIWMSSFAPQVPLANDIDFDYLAESFELSGGNIKNIVLNATFLAAADGGKVEMKHIMRAVFKENTKDKRISFTSDYGQYAYMVYQ